MKIIGEPGRDFLGLLEKDNSFVKEVNNWAYSEFPYDEAMPRGFEDRLSDF